MGKFEEIADKMILYKVKTTWLKIEKFYNEIASANDSSLSMAFVLLAIDNEKGSTVTSIAPRIGMEPNSLSRILKRLKEKDFVYKKQSLKDKRKVYICLTKLGLEKKQIALENINKLENLIINSSNKNDIEGFFAVSDSIKNSIDSINKK